LGRLQKKILNQSEWDAILIPINAYLDQRFPERKKEVAQQLWKHFNSYIEKSLYNGPSYDLVAIAKFINEQLRQKADVLEEKEKQRKSQSYTVGSSESDRSTYKSAI
jgi:hypothetical protein